MPVKNVKRKTNDGFEGVITGLNDKEKEIIANSVGIEANPTDAATATLNKLRIGDDTYNVGGDRCLVVTGEFMQQSGDSIINTFTLSEEDRQKVLNKEIDVISGTFKESADDEDPSYFTAVRADIHEYEGQKIGVFLGSYISAYTTNKMQVYGYQIALNPGMNIIQVYKQEVFLSPAVLPADFNIKTFTFKSVNGVPTWVDTSVGTQNFENINVNGTITASGKKLDDSFAVSMSFTNEEIVSALDGDVTKTYTGDDVAQLDKFVEGQNGKILASLVTPVGTINITLYPCSFGGDVMYSFQGLMNIHTNFESIGGKRYSTLFVSVIKLLGDPLETHSKFSIRLVGIGA